MTGAVNVTVGMVRHTLHDIEDWVDDVRMVLASLDPDSTIAAVSEVTRVPSAPEIDGILVAEGAPAIAHKSLRSQRLVTELISGGIIGPPRPPCTTPLAVCDPELERGKPIFPRDVAAALRGIEILTAVCRNLISRMPEQPIR